MRCRMLGTVSGSNYHRKCMIGVHIPKVNYIYLVSMDTMGKLRETTHQ